MTDRPTDPTPEDAIRLLCTDYNAEIRALAKEALAVPEEERNDWLHEAIDGHERVIYTYKARSVLVCSDHPEAYREELGEEPASVEQAAYFAILADVHELLANPYFTAGEEL